VYRSAVRILLLSMPDSFEHTPSLAIRIPNGALTSLAGNIDEHHQVAVADLFTGMYASTAILAALRHRGLTGEGQAIDMALLDSQVAMLANLGANYLTTGVAPQRMGNAHQNIVPYQVFEVADGHIILAVGNDGQFAKFCEVAGRTDIAQDARFVRNADRVRHRATLVPLLADMLKQRNKNDWLSALEAAKVPCGAINNLAEVFDDPHVKERGMPVEVDHPLAGPLPIVASPMKLSATPVQYRRAPPLLGEHTEELLSEFGLEPHHLLGIFCTQQFLRELEARASACEPEFALHFRGGGNGRSENHRD